MRRVPSLLAVALVGVLVMTACGDDDDSTAGSEGATTAAGSDSTTAGADATTSASTDSSAGATVTAARVPGEPGDLPTVSGELGAKPVLELPDVEPPTELEVVVVSEGTGAEVAAGDTLVANYVGVVWADGRQFDASWDRGEPVGFPIGVGQVIDGWDQALVGQHLGSRVLLVIPPEQGYGAEGNPQAGISGTDTLVFVVDLVSSFGQSIPAAGEAGPADTTGELPLVSGAVDGKPVIEIPEGVDPPAELVVQPLIIGAGPPVEEGQTIAVQYVGIKWADGAEFDSSWDRGESVQFPIGVGQVIPGWDNGLVGATAGSRVLLVIPPAEGYGEQGQSAAGISGTDTLVFVVDVLGSY